MPCGGPKKALNGSPLNPVSLSLRAATENRTTEKKQVSRKQELKKAAKVEFHCETCGHTGPNRVHSCPGKRLVAYQIHRLKKCDVCIYNKDRVCTLYKSQHPDRDCDIDVGVQMPEARCPSGMWDRVLFRCDKCKSVSFNENGLTACPVCKKSDKRACSMPWIFSAKDEPIEPIQPFAIITMAGDQKSLDVLELTRPAMERYAARVGADFHAIIDNKEPRYPVGNKFRLRSLAAKYERTLFIDADVWIRDRADNLFDLVPVNTVGIHQDFQYLQSKSWIKDEGKRLSEEQQVKPIKLQVLNTGVVLFGNEHLYMWDSPPLPAQPRHLSEQTWVEYNLQSHVTPTTFIDTKFNTQWWFPKFKELEPVAEFIHLANCPHDERIYRLKKYTMESR